MSDPTKAVFLSYAREDAAAAQRIADAQRGRGENEKAGEKREAESGEFHTGGNLMSREP